MKKKVNNFEMSKFCFYCDEDEPEEFPDFPVGFIGSPSNDLKRKHRNDNDKFDVYRRTNNALKDLIRDEGVEITKEHGFHCVKAAHIPKLRTRLIKEGWVEEYIPPGP